jgi:NAD+ diphosphatase
MHSPRAPLAFTTSPLDRAGDRRCDPAWLAAKRRASDALILPLRQLQPLILDDASTSGPRIGLLDAVTVERLDLPDGPEVFLGLDGGRAHFARDVTAAPEAAASALLRLGQFRDARASAPFLSPGEIALLGQAKAMIDWHARTRFCGTCGQGTESADGGYRRFCPRCGAEHFPRTDPVVIMLVTDGEDCLLARNKRYGSNRIYSTLAGFMEPGETIEEAVRREVFEEAGIRTGRVRYFASQPWPFPHSLMIGCYAEANSREIAIDGHEIVAARWFAKDEIRTMIADGYKGETGLPRREAIAFHLIREWADA